MIVDILGKGVGGNKMLHKHLMPGSVVDRLPPQQLLLSLVRSARYDRSEPCITCFCPQQHHWKGDFPHKGKLNDPLQGSLNQQTALQVTPHFILTVSG